MHVHRGGVDIKLYQTALNINFICSTALIYNTQMVIFLSHIYNNSYIFFIPIKSNQSWMIFAH